MNNFPIVKGKHLIDCKSEYHYSAFDYDVINYAISTISKEDKDFKNIIINISELYEEIMGHPLRGAERMKIVTDLNALLPKNIKINDKDGEGYKKIPWFSELAYEGRDGSIKIVFNERMALYLLGLDNKNEGFSSVDNRIYVLKEVYTKRLYEMMNALYGNVKKKTFHIDEIREHLMVAGKHKRVNHLKERVIDPAIKDINTFADFTLSYEVKKEGRRIVGFTFTKTYKIKEERDQIQNLFLF